MYKNLQRTAISGALFLHFSNKINVNDKNIECVSVYLSKTTR